MYRCWGQAAGSDPAWLVEAWLWVWEWQGVPLGLAGPAKGGAARVSQKTLAPQEGTERGARLGQCGV